MNQHSDCNCHGHARPEETPRLPAAGTGIEPAERMRELEHALSEVLKAPIDQNARTTVTAQSRELQELAVAHGRVADFGNLLSALDRALAPAAPAAETAPEQRLDGRDHRQLASEMELFAQMPFAPGAPILLKNGLTIFRELQDKMRGLLNEVGGYQEVRAPILCKQELWHTSGHIEKYGKNMFLFNDGHYDVGLKPMNCPAHMMIFDMKGRSYRELPFRLHDEGTLHRNENVGSLTGMTRLRQFHQDDTHIFLAHEMLEEEINRLLSLIDRVYGRMGIEYKLKLSTRPDNFIGTLDVWERAESTLEGIMRSRNGGQAPEIDAGGGAFYGPKIDVDIKDAFGKWWQVATTQLDFNLPERFDLKYRAKHGGQERPVVIHTAVFGTLERFMAILLESSQGNLPTWMAPEQVRVIPVSEQFNEYAAKVAARLRALGARVELDDSNDRLNGKIMAARPLRAPYQLVVGAREAAAETVSVRGRGGANLGVKPLSEFEALLKTELAFRL